MDSSAPKNNVRYLMALVLMALVIGGLAFVLQFLPNWRSHQVETGPDRGQEGPAVCRFLATQAVWEYEFPIEDAAEAKKFRYVKEIEKGDHGQYDFPFENPSEVEGEMGLHFVSCACSAILVAFVSEPAWTEWTEARKKDPALEFPEGGASWVRLVREGEETTEGKAAYPERRTVALPPKAKGVVRLTWDGRADSGQFLRLTPRVWAQPTGNLKQRFFWELEVPVRITRPLQFFPTKLNLGAIGHGGKGSGQIFVWSATRTDPTVRFQDDPPLFQAEARRVDPKEFKSLKKKIFEEEKLLTQIEAAWAVTATVLEESREKGKTVQHDLGPFSHTLRVTVDGEPAEQPPQVTGVITIPSHITIGEVKDQNRIDLGAFDPGRGTSRKVIIWTDAESVLEYDRHEPVEMQVKLSQDEKGSSATRKKWLMDVSVPRDALFGPFPERSAVYLRLQGDPPRLIRIPVVGTAQLR